MNATTQCLRRLGWITAVFALAPGVMLLAISTTEGRYREAVDCGGAADCLEAARQRAPSPGQAWATDGERKLMAQHAQPAPRRIASVRNG